MAEVQTFCFACDGTETLRGRAFFQIEASDEAEARAKLADDPSEFFTDFSESDGNTSFDAETPDAFDLL